MTAANPQPSANRTLTPAAAGRLFPLAALTALLAPVVLASDRHPNNHGRPPSRPELARLLGISDQSVARYERTGLTLDVADRLAVAAGFHPVEVWPEMAANSTCEQCGRPMVAQRSTRRYCRTACRLQAYRSTPERAEAARRSAADYYAENADYCRARERRRYRANRAEVA